MWMFDQRRLDDAARRCYRDSRPSRAADRLLSNIRDTQRRDVSRVNLGLGPGIHDRGGARRGHTPWSKVPCVPLGNSSEESTMRCNFAWSLGFCVLFVVPAASAQVLKCTDAEGNVTYSDVPCLRSEKTTVVDTRASSNVMDHSSIRAHQGRLAAAPQAAPVSAAPPATPPSSTTASTVNRQVQPARTYSR